MMERLKGATFGDLWRGDTVREAVKQALDEFCAELFQREDPQSNEVLANLELQRPQGSPTLLVVTFRPNDN